MYLSCDDGCKDDIRVAELAKKYGIKVVFYWPVEWHSLANLGLYEPLSFNDAQDIAEDFEVGSHSITHEHLTRIPEEIAMYEISESKTMLENLFGVEVTKFAPPRGYTNTLLTEYTMKFYEKQRLTKGKGLVHVHPDSGANGNMHWLQRAKNEVVEELWMHSWELNKYDEWDNLENYLRDNT